MASLSSSSLKPFSSMKLHRTPYTHCPTSVRFPTSSPFLGRPLRLTSRARLLPSRAVVVQPSGSWKDFKLIAGGMAAAMKIVLYLRKLFEGEEKKKHAAKDKGDSREPIYYISNCSNSPLCLSGGTQTIHAPNSFFVGKQSDDSRAKEGDGNEGEFGKQSEDLGAKQQDDNEGEEKLPPLWIDVVRYEEKVKVEVEKPQQN